MWSSASALDPQEYALLDMHLRRGLGAGELADTLGLERGAVYTRLSRLRGSLDESVRLTLLLRRGSEDCPELEAIVADAGGAAPSPDLRRDVREHLDDCDLRGEQAPLRIAGGDLRRARADPTASWRARGDLGGAGGVRRRRPRVGRRRRAARARRRVKCPESSGARVAGVVAAVGAAVAIFLAGGGDVRDPDRVESSSHRVGAASTNPVISMSWSKGENADGYSVTFSRDPAALPPERVNVEGTSTASRSLAPWPLALRAAHARRRRRLDEHGPPRAIRDRGGGQQALAEPARPRRRERRRRAVAEVFTSRRRLPPSSSRP